MSDKRGRTRLLSAVCAAAISLNFTLPQVALAATTEDSQDTSSAQTLDLKPAKQDNLLAYASTNSPQLDDLNRQIIKKEIELLRYNTDFRNHYMAPNKNKQRRLKFYDAVGGGIANAKWNKHGHQH